MKSIAICVFTLFALVFLGCKQQKKEEQSKSEEVLEKATSVEQEQIIVPVERYFTDAPVAVVKNGEIEYTDYDAFLEKWRSVTGKGGGVDGVEVKKADIEEKQKKLEEMKAFHFFTNLGTKVASTVAIFFQHLINIIIDYSFKKYLMLAK